jgi:ABC-type nitrate/sulfonate/bicarbonate transport system substrate-binding protein
MMNDLHCIPDYYTPVIITSEKMISEQPDVVKRFMAATSAGYEFAIAHPSDAADILLAAAPELDKGLVQRSQAYLSQQYQADAPRWGEQRTQVWHDYAQWMADRQLIAHMIEPDKAFTNAFLPAASAWQH